MIIDAFNIRVHTIKFKLIILYLKVIYIFVSSLKRLKAKKKPIF